MKICYLSADRGIRFDKYNGASAHLRSMVKTIRELGHDIDLVTVSRPENNELGIPIYVLDTPETLSWIFEQTEPVGNRETKAKKRADRRIAHSLGHVWNNVVVERQLNELLRKEKPDLLFEVHSPFAAAGGVIARKLGIRHVLNVHAPLAWEGATYRNEALSEAAEFLEKTALSTAGRIITISEEMKAQLIAMEVPEDKIAVVCNGVDTVAYQAQVEREHEDGNVVTIGFSGSLKAWHGIDVLAQAFSAIADDCRARLLIVGDGPERRIIEELKERYPGRIEYTGAIHPDEVPEYVKRMDIAVAPYPPMDRFYFSPLKILDYMSAGCAVIASDIGQVPTLVNGGENGVLVPPGDHDALAHMLKDLLDDPERRRKLGTQAATWVRAHYGWPRKVSEMLDWAMAD